MIRFTLSCPDGHSFDSWFATGAAFDSLRAAGHLSCAVCGNTAVDKALMAPAVRTDAPDAPPARTPDTSGPLTAPASPAEQALAALRRRIEATSDYVGLSFAAEARAIHDGTAPDRPIYGEARLDEARRLIEDGVPVAPLPFRPRSRSN